MRTLVLVVVFCVALAGCSSDGASSGETETTLASTTTATTTAVSTTIVETTTTTTIAGTTSTLPTAQTTTTVRGAAVFAFTRIAFGDPAAISITNIGTSTGTMEGYWLCQQTNHFSLPAIELEPGEFITVSAGSATLPDLIGPVIVVDAGRSLGTVDGPGGEMALFDSGSFGEPSALVDYVAWGPPPHQTSDVATEAGIWEQGGFVEVPDEALGITVGRIPPAGPQDWVAEIGG